MNEKYEINDYKRMALEAIFGKKNFQRNEKIIVLKNFKFNPEKPEDNKSQKDN